jgi:3-deoxy-D-manno-octulosonate 8-phosphate phosphatase (KDO 8-P phosphatase)
MNDKLKNIQVLVMDVDGVMTDGKIVFDSNGNELKFFCVKDGFGLARWHKLGKKSAIITARYSKPVEVRAKGLNIDLVFQDAYPKMEYYEKVLQEFGAADDQVCYIGDDLADISIIKRVGIGVAVANAAQEVKDAAGCVTKNAGGNGAVREVIEMILKAQGLWVIEG